MARRRMVKAMQMTSLVGMCWLPRGDSSPATTSSSCPEGPDLLFPGGIESYLESTQDFDLDPADLGLGEQSSQQTRLQRTASKPGPRYRLQQAVCRGRSITQMPMRIDHLARQNLPPAGERLGTPSAFSVTICPVRPTAWETGR